MVVERTFRLGDEGDVRPLRRWGSIPLAALLLFSAVAGLTGEIAWRRIEVSPLQRLLFVFLLGTREGVLVDG